MSRAIDKETMLNLIIDAKRTDPETGSFSEWLAEYLVEHLPTLTPPNEWVSVEERLPKQYKTVIVHFGNGKIEFDWADQQGHFLLESCYGRATHWMLLPEPPDHRAPVGEGDKL